MSSEAIGRRTAIGGAAALAAGAALSACSGGTTTAASTTSAPAGGGSTSAAGGTTSAAGATTSAAAAGAASSASSAASSAAGGPALTSTSDVAVGGGVILQDAKLVVTQPTSGDFKAFSAVCTHQGCLVSTIEGSDIVCACHGSKFSIADGSVVAGPANAPLKSTAITVTGQDITLAG